MMLPLHLSMVLCPSDIFGRQLPLPWLLQMWEWQLLFLLHGLWLLVLLR